MGYMMTIGPGMTLFKNVNVVDAKEWLVVVAQFVHKWIDENSEKGKETVVE